MGEKTSKNRRVPDSLRWIFVFFSKHVWEPHRYVITRYYFDNHEYQPWYPAWSTTGLVTISNTRPSPLQIYSSRHKTDWPAIPGQTETPGQTDRRTDRNSIWVSRPRQRDEQKGPDLGFRTSTDGQDLDFQDLDGQTDARTDKAINTSGCPW